MRSISRSIHQMKFSTSSLHRRVFLEFAFEYWGFRRECGASFWHHSDIVRKQLFKQWYLPRGCFRFPLISSHMLQGVQSMRSICRLRIHLCCDECRTSKGILSMYLIIFPPSWFDLPNLAIWLRIPQIEYPLRKMGGYQRWTTRHTEARDHRTSDKTF